MFISFTGLNIYSEADTMKQNEHEKDFIGYSTLNINYEKKNIYYICCTYYSNKL